VDEVFHSPCRTRNGAGLDLVDEPVETLMIRFEFVTNSAANPGVESTTRKTKT
jgi:hypothetical protein